MSFTSNLIKGFIRSAVNQVGRDGGRVISNKIYQNNHATPVNMVNHLHESNTYTEQNTNIQQERISTKYNVLKYIFAFIFTYSLPIIGAIITIIYGLLRFYQKNKSYNEKVLGYVNVPDRRYRSGYRSESRMMTKVRLEPLSEENRLIVKNKGKTYLWIGLSNLVIYLYLMFG